MSLFIRSLAARSWRRSLIVQLRSFVCSFPFLVTVLACGFLILGCSLSVQEPKADGPALTVVDHSVSDSGEKDAAPGNLVHVRGADHDGTAPVVSIEPAQPAKKIPEQAVSEKKRLFIKRLLPVVQTALREVENERRGLEEILQKIGVPSNNVVFSEEMISRWGANLSNEEQRQVLLLVRKYRTSSGAELVQRIQGLPVSLILAQGALESSWGTSRFALEGNNLFGMWTWGKKGMVPLGRDEGKSHKVAMYDSALDSVRAYILNINRHQAYSNLRKIRLESSDSYFLAEGLQRYSERGDAYVDDLQQVIRVNRLQTYDSLRLAAL